MKDLRFLFQQKRNSKIRLSDDLALSVYYTIKKMITFISSRYEEKPARVNGMLKKLILIKTENKIFDAVCVFIRNKSAY
jgi:uncharacterized ubiquitin-like protein YukD